MYNRYITRGDYIPAGGEERGREPGQESKRSLLGSLLGGGAGFNLDGVLKALHLDRFDKGDILLILVLVYLYIESDDEDWLIVLALVVLMGF